jgi:hypothetical protein
VVLEQRALRVPGVEEVARDDQEIVLAAAQLLARWRRS